MTDKQSKAYTEAYNEGYAAGTSTARFEEEVIEAEAAERAYNELWDAILITAMMTNEERIEHFCLANLVTIITNKDYKDIIIQAQAYKEAKGILRKEHMQILQRFISFYGESALQAAITKIQEEKR